MSDSMQLGRLEKVELREIWLSEASYFTPWLAREENIQLLSDTVGIDLEVEGQEKNVEPFRADILCRDTATGHWVLIENQLERTDHIHLGQLLTYAAGLNAVTIIWVAQRFTEEHRAALDWLNNITSEDINFFGLEVELWRIANSPVAPKFNIVCKPNDWTQTISSAARAMESESLSETRTLQLEFWTKFHEHLAATNRSVRGPKPLPQSWNNFAIGRSEFWLEAFCNVRDRYIGVQLVCGGESARPHFEFLRSQAANIEQSIGEPLEWEAPLNRKHCRIGLWREESDPADRLRWHEQHEWLASKAQRFHDVFRPIVKDLDVDESPEAHGEAHA